jgi:hypothetical protein
VTLISVNTIDFMEHLQGNNTLRREMLADIRTITTETVLFQNAPQRGA